ncbi:MAG: thiolase family protein [Planctomycetota bacterium]|nr:thiolase family protein [Planctomycetota bacterium]
MERVAVLRALRTPIGKYLGGLSKVSAASLGEPLVRALVDGLDVSIDEVIFGCARQAGQGPNPARQIAYRAGLGDAVPANTINMACGSGLKTIALGAELIGVGRAKAVIAGGVESMSQVPFLLKKMRMGYRLGHGKLVDDMYDDGFHCRLADQVMGLTAETLAEQYDIDRDEQDAFALASQHKAGRAWEAGAFADEIVPITVPGRKGDTVVDQDEHMRPNTTLEKLAKLPPVFKKDGTVHAGNSSGITDGGAAVLLVAESEVERLGVEPLGWFEDWAVAGVDPKIMGIAPVPAVQGLLARRGGELDDFDLIELNEAFAAQVIACERDLGFDRDKLNVHGGAIALGHPIGCTGARIAVTLLHAMRRHGKKTGLATLCISGGQGFAASFCAN